jgi:hypothetical protein
MSEEVIEIALPVDTVDERPKIEPNFDNILIPMPTVEQPDADEMLIHPVTQVDQLLKESGIPIEGVSQDANGGYRIDFQKEATEEQKAQAAELLKSRTFEPLRPMTIADLAPRLTDEQIAGAMRHAAAREFLTNAELAKQLKVDIYVSDERPVPVEPDDQRLSQPTVLRQRRTG